MSDEQLSKKIRLGTLLMVGLFGGILFLLWSILSRLNLGDITIQVFLLLLILLMIRPRQPIVIPVPVPQNPFQHYNKEEGMEVG